jgi:2,4-dienoyl-CoA reductase (NADPH2)
MTDGRAKTAFPLLFSPARVGALKLRNRVVCAPALTALARDGSVTDELVAAYREKARGGAGLIVFESAPVHPSGAGFAHCVRPYEPGASVQLGRVADAVREHGAEIVAQLWHCGRQGSSRVTGMPLVAPSSVACPVHAEVPAALTREGIAELVGAFAASAHVFREAGFGGVELAAGHGYLIHQFLSPLSNRRHDAYGGSRERRAQFLLEVVDAIRQACGPAFVLGLRLSAHELLQGGFVLGDTLALVRAIVALGAVDYLSVSAGTHASVEQMVGDWSVPRGNLVAFAEQTRRVAGGLPVIACGRILDPGEAEAVLERGEADLVALARALIADPRWPDKARSGRSRAIRPCISCNECESRLFRELPVACAVNPALPLDIPAAEPKRVVVVGGGVAGMEAARTAAVRGHDVSLFEESSALGGQLGLVEALGTRPGFERIVSYLLAELDRLGVDVRLGTRADRVALTGLAPDAVVVATGATPTLPTPVEVAVRRATSPELGGCVALVDRGVSHDRLLAVAEALLAPGRVVHVVTERPALGSELSFISLAGVRARLRAGGAVLHCGSEIVGFTSGAFPEPAPREVEIAPVSAARRTRLRALDSLVMFGAPSPRTDLLDELQGTVTHLLAAGDCVAPRDLERAFHEGRHAGLTV